MTLRGRNLMHMKTWGLVALVGLLAAPGAAGQDAPSGHGDDQHEAQDLALAASPSLALFPDHQEVVDRIIAAEQHPWIKVYIAGISHGGRPIYVVEATDRDSPVPFEDRVVTLLSTQQHGNEPAGTPAALDLLESIVAEEPDTLAQQVLLVMPMVNPDGAGTAQRANQDNVDLNRDHVHLTQPESHGLHWVLNEWNVHVAVDHHEYSGVGAGDPVPVRAYDYDLTTLFPRHGNVRQPTLDAAMDLMYQGMWPSAEAAGFTVNEYGEYTVAGTPIAHNAGGPDPGILRNALGLDNVAGILVETRVDAHPNPFQDAERRADIHRTVMEATIEYVAANAQRFKDAKMESERLNVEEPLTEYVEAWPDDPATGSPGEARRGPLAIGYRTNDDLSPLMKRHSLAPGFAHEGSWVYDMATPRAGMLAAILHPDSSRQVTPDVTPLDTVPVPASNELAASSDATVPAAPVAALLVALAGLALTRRRHH